jgi:mannose/fructose/N-acetylgalactosamine-specific phosphotransferase system component IIB
MVELLRVDSRLLHGQVAVSWMNNIRATSILVADDAVMADEVGKMALRMAKPEGANLAIRSIEGGAELLNNPRVKDTLVFVLVRTINDALRLVELAGNITHVNIGGIRRKEGAKLVRPAVYLNEDDVEILKALIEKVERVEFQMVPTDSSKSAESIIRSFK